MTWLWARRFLVFAAISGAVALVGCGGGGTSPATAPSSSSTPNVQTIEVNTGPAAQAGGNSSINSAFTSVTVCVPGTTQCTTVNGVLVDTGSMGLRILSSALGSLPLPAETQNSNPLAECAPFVSTVTWGPVVSADVEIAGEKASSVPIQVIGGSGLGSAVPSSCVSSVTPAEDLSSLGANGILGVGPFVQDCGVGCTSSYSISSGQNLEFYYSCPSSNPGNCTPATAGLTQQVENPVAAFPTDNNGVVIELPSVPDATAETSLTGSLIFGIGTQSNNALNGATVYAISQTTGNISTQYNNALYPGFIDSGSGAYFFLDPTTTGLSTNCAVAPGLYCPSPNVVFSGLSNIGADGTTSSPFSFTVGDADTLLSNPNNGVANGLAGPSASSSANDYFDWGLPFFYGRTVFTAISGAGTPGGPGPYYAY